jgi:hypothetical protein
MIKDVIIHEMDITMPPSFPMDEFRKFGIATVPFFPKILSNEDLADPLKRRAHCDASWQAVRYRYRLCSECNDEFKTLLANPSAMWTAGWGDEELSYKLERCIYTFFMGGLSVFDSFAYCLYFVGQSIQPAGFPAIAVTAAGVADVAKLRQINRKATADAFAAAFPHVTITTLLAGLSRSNPKFSAIDELRNIVGHRLSGRHSSRSSHTMNADGTLTTDFHEETWFIPGAAGNLAFDAEMLQRVLVDVAGLVKTLTAAALEFAEGHTPAKVTA